MKILQQYYRSENAYVENGNLVIVARKESYGGDSLSLAAFHTEILFAGSDYTSSRLKTEVHVIVMPL